VSCVVAHLVAATLWGRASSETSRPPRRAPTTAAIPTASSTRAGTAEDVERFSKRTVKMDKGHIDDCMKLLTLMGMPVIVAPCEARETVPRALAAELTSA
jgi:hypothetical protein